MFINLITIEKLIGKERTRRIDCIPDKMVRMTIKYK